MEDDQILWQQYSTFGPSSLLTVANRTTEQSKIQWHEVPGYAQQLKHIPANPLFDDDF
jgi:hypothetical protein